MNCDGLKVLEMWQKHACYNNGLSDNESEIGEILERNVQNISKKFTYKRKVECKEI